MRMRRGKRWRLLNRMRRRGGDFDGDNIHHAGRDSSVGVATRYGLDGPGIEFLWGRDFPHPSIPAPGAHPTSYTMGTGSFPGVKRPGRGVDHPPHLAPRLKKEWSYTSTPLLGLRGQFYVELQWPEVFWGIRSPLLQYRNSQPSHTRASKSPRHRTPHRATLFQCTPAQLTSGTQMFLSPLHPTFLKSTKNVESPFIRLWNATFALEQAMMAQRGRRGTTLFFL